MSKSGSVMNKIPSTPKPGPIAIMDLVTPLIWSVLMYTSRLQRGIEAWYSMAKEKAEHPRRPKTNGFAEPEKVETLAAWTLNSPGFGVHRNSSPVYILRRSRKSSTGNLRPLVRLSSNFGINWYAFDCSFCWILHSSFTL